MAEAAAGGGDWKLAVAAFTVLIGIFGVLTFLVLRSSFSEAEEAEERPARGGQRRRGASSAAAEADEDEEDEAPEGDRAARRNAKKQQKKQERREQVQADREVRQQQDTAKSDKQRKYEQKQQEKEAERLKKEKQEEKVRLEKERKEQVEYERWKKTFTVEEEGFADSNEHDESNSIIEYVRMRKVVHLEDLAAEFHMRISAAVDRLEQLEKLGRLNGIFDDCGKYVYVTQEEMSAVADWLKKKGRINRAELAAACNGMIRLDPTAEDAAKLELEVKAAVELLEEGIGGGAEGH